MGSKRIGCDFSMKNLLLKLGSIIPGLKKTSSGPGLSQEELTAEFRSRYHNFKLLLAANNKALELMAELESALVGDRVYGMSFIRGVCTSLGVNVFQMINLMNELAPEKYQVLFERHQEIQKAINQILAPKLPSEQGELILDLDQVTKNEAHLVGNKMANLGEVRNRIAIPTPPGFCLTARAFHFFLSKNNLIAEIDRLLQSAVLERMDDLFKLSSQIQQKIVKAPVPEEMTRQIEDAYARLEKQAGKGVTVSLRSSALGEDSAKASFAGQYASHLNVSPQHILDTYKEVVASKYTPQAMHYRLMRGIRDSDVAMCVGCLAMVDAKSGGVVYTANPLKDGDDAIQVNATLGLPRSVVDGRTQADLFVVERGESLTIKEESIVQKDTAYVCYPEEGICRLTPTGDEAKAPSLTDKQVLDIAQKSLTMEKHYGSYQDVEWAYDHEGNLFILQTRPLGQSEEPEKPKQEVPVKAEPWIKDGLKISPGSAFGPVYWVRKNSDAMRFPDQAVLVVEQPSPRWAALLGRAVAVLSGTGGMAGHLATVAREYRLPGVFNLKDELDKLENGIEITVDADQGRIFKGLVEEVLQNTERRQSLIQGSPVHKTLEKALKLITPLNLLDPDSLAFKGANCQTFHDLTRFCHEKSVQEMFNFNKEDQFAAKASKQLHYKVPMQWWIINLDDGFKEEVNGKYVKLDQIACTPLLALWEGMVAIPWQGPPAVSGKGFASVMFQATTNPALATPFKTSFSNKNYFMISRYFMNLQSRFGFHFATVEAMAGPRLMENYLSFAFKGGAADLKRKHARVQFLAEILDELDFRVSIKEDTAQARVEQISLEDMEMRLRVVGYLLMHTRQLDMVMTDPKAVTHYRNKMNSDIEKINRQFKSH